MSATPEREQARAQMTPAARSIPTAEIAAAAVALTEMRGFVVGGPAREREFMLPRIDRCLDVIGGDVGLAKIVRAIHHDVLEGRPGDELAGPAEGLL